MLNDLDQSPEQTSVQTAAYKRLLNNRRVQISKIAFVGTGERGYCAVKLSTNRDLPRFHSCMCIDWRRVELMEKSATAYRSVSLPRSHDTPTASCHRWPNKEISRIFYAVKINFCLFVVFRMFLLVPDDLDRTRLVDYLLASVFNALLH